MFQCAVCVHESFVSVYKNGCLRPKRTTCVHFCWGSLGSYTVILGWSVVVIMAFPQLHSQSLQSVLLVQPGHTFLDK